MKNSFVAYLISFFGRRVWDPNSITGLGEWELSAPGDIPAVTQEETPRGTPHPHLPISDRLKKVQADLDAFDKSLPDLNEYGS
jgi:hypothetical protein